MIVNTHLLMSHILYDYLSKRQNIKINKLAFLYGCVKPDINNADINQEHTLDNSINSLNKYSEKLLTNNISIKDFSVSLGVICHFICDYFCLYHNDEYCLKNNFQHFLYEIRLHYKFLILLLMGKLKIDNFIPSEKDLIPMVLELQQKYFLEEKNLTRDIKYALSSAAAISEFILCSSEIALNSSKALTSEIYP
ncbi:hypothetical protein CLHOM_33610 [Clostridium homopropionicum DSM 5847]|uniref:Phospholipase C/D domain-containing protein n=1 Tax=Clostridium homopropionicum DSM 5847 TaxID=1121318 RepID=A0A0L6Z661_9CLOT|nr:zinc dependent phospholipase C family protein [Clostridium homopropionicum]KOA18459.1 hypothetical protein CLHOM_33610 [Clostridium homopropionicum DSM 5847]SFF66419.1 Zinc dependent phospholipase C [Clostridium homopropionicum]